MTTKPCVMLVEDNPITRKLVRAALYHESIDLLEAGDGATAMAVARDRRPDLILQDLVLPDTDGFELVRRLREIPEVNAVPILAFSGLLSHLDEKRVAESGFTDFVIKPIDPAQLVRIVRAHLPANEPVQPTFAGHRCIILADDDDVQRKLTVFRLTRLGYHVVDVADGQAALDAARASRPDAVVTDAMMPGLDGFGLCAALRKDPALKNVPIVLCTSTYVDAADRELARLAGANEFVIRTPDLREMIAALETVLATPMPAPAASVQAPEFEREHASRTMVQLERQAAAAANARQQCAMLSAELAVLNAISEAITQDKDIDQVLREILAACCDAGGVSIGALYLTGAGGEARTIVVGGERGRYRTGTAALGDALTRLGAIGPTASARVVSRSSASAGDRSWLDDGGLESALIVPLHHKEDSLGALVMMSEIADLSTDDRLIFAQAVGHQVSVALTLTQAFDDSATAASVAREHAALLESVFTSISDPIAVFDASARATTWNAAAEPIIGAARSETEGADYSEWSRGIALLRADKSTALELANWPLMRALNGETVDRMVGFITYPAKPEGAWVSMSARPLHDDAGKVTGAVAVSRDITSERNAQEQLMISDRMASIGMITAGVGHEINNPLTAVIGNLEMATAAISALPGDMRAQLGELPDEIKEALEAANRVKQIALDLKVFSGSQADANQALHVEDVLDSAVRMGWSEIRQKARLVKKYGQVPPALGSASRLGQVLLNLIVNAAQAIADGHPDANSITLITRIDDQNRIVIDIEDTGAGIAPSVMQQLFTPFMTTKPVGIGTGLGLSICRRLVTAMGGSIWADSTVGAGTTFHVALPRAQTSSMHIAAASAKSGDTGTARILVVDDEEMIGMILRRALKPHDITVRSSASDALAQISGGARFDAILCDLMMPGMTGMEFHSALSGRFPDQARAMMFLTGGAFSSETAAFLDSVPNEQLEKPFDITRLKEKINRHLRARAADHHPPGEAA